MVSVEFVQDGQMSYMLASKLYDVAENDVVIITKIG